MTDEPTTDVYPELEKQRAVMADAQVISGFLDWLGEADYIISRYIEIEGRDVLVLAPTRKTLQQLLEEYFGIDPVKIEAERRQILAELRRQNEERDDG